MRLLSELLLFPVTGPARGVSAVVKRIRDQVESEFLDEQKVRAELLDTEMRYSQGELTEQEYQEREAAALERLNEIRAYKESLARQEADASGDDAV